MQRLKLITPLNSLDGLLKRQFESQVISEWHLPAIREFWLRTNQLVSHYLLLPGTSQQEWQLARLVRQLRLVAQ
jgi:hypothetical protein